ncbi:hypothetical protein KAU33_11520 [Candidatus Dependentiae bacterium]|nr:hypothetical protein [Candidatus Dependentiae bacterium]
MIKKIAISLPQEDFDKMEKARKKLGLKRSKFIYNTIRFWLKYQEKQELIRQYEEGYKKYPETEEELAELEVWEKAYGEALEEEGLL